MSDNITQKYISIEIMNKYNNSLFRIPLRNREGIIIEYSLVDEDDFEKVNKYKWFLSDGRYARGSVDGVKYGLSRFIFYGQLKNSKIIDHINRDGLDNRKCNLREVTHSENAQNRSMKSTKTTSKYIGVRKTKTNFSVSCMRKYFGCYDNEIQAATVYDIYTYQNFGQHALNNRLITYEESIKTNTILPKSRDSKVMKNDLPENVYYAKREDAYYARKIYSGKQYRGFYRKTLIEAINDIIEINTKINKLKVVDEINHYFREITKDVNGIAYIIVNDTKVYIDDDLWHKFSLMSWHRTASGYFQNGKLGIISRIVMNAKKDEFVDHINNNKNDNRRINLRIVTSTQNNHNKLKQVGRSSKYNGVCFHKRDKIWNAYIAHENKRYSLGYYENEIDAAKAYNKKALELYGSFANLNQL